MHRIPFHHIRKATQTLGVELGEELEEDRQARTLVQGRRWLKLTSRDSPPPPTSPSNPCPSTPSISASSPQPGNASALSLGRLARACACPSSGNPPNPPNPCQSTEVNQLATTAEVNQLATTACVYAPKWMDVHLRSTVMGLPSLVSGPSTVSGLWSKHVGLCTSLARPRQLLFSFKRRHQRALKRRQQRAGHTLWPALPSGTNAGSRPGRVGRKKGASAGALGASAGRLRFLMSSRLANVCVIGAHAPREHRQLTQPFTLRQSPASER
jgi:hypothetical protein